MNIEAFEKFKENEEYYTKMCDIHGKIDQGLYIKYDVKRGLRDSDGRGVLTGLTEISDVSGFRVQGSDRIPIDGELFYQGYDVKELVKGFNGNKHGFEETIFLLLFGELPTKQQLDEFMELLGILRPLPENFNRDIIMKQPSKNIMNVLQRCVLTLYSYDDNPDDIAREIADDFRRRRVEKNLTRKQVAEKAGIPVSNIVRFEQKGLISLKNLIGIAIALGYVSELKTVFSQPKYSTMEELTQIRKNSKRTKAYKL